MPEYILLDDSSLTVSIYTEESIRAAGGPGSGNFGHAGRPGEVGGSADMGAEVGGSLHAQREEGVRKVGALLDKAVSSASFTASVKDDDYEPELVQKWDNVSGAGQEAAEQAFRTEAYDNGVDVDDSEIINDLYKDLYKNNEDVVKDATQTLLDSIDDPDNELSASFREAGSLPFEAGTTTRQYKLDPDTIEVEDDDGDGATLNEDALRLTNGDPLTPLQLEAVDKIWTDAYNERMEKEKEGVTQSDEYYERRNELEFEAISEQWNNMSDEQKLSYLPDKYADESYSSEGDEESATTELTFSPGPPDNWIIDTEVDDSGHPTDSSVREDYLKTRILARQLADLRTDELLTARGLSTNGARDIPKDVWNEWKGSSTSGLGLALQLAAAEELGGLHRLTPNEERRARDAAEARFSVSVDVDKLPQEKQNEIRDKYVDEMVDYHLKSWHQIQLVDSQIEGTKPPSEAALAAQKEKLTQQWREHWEGFPGYARNDYAQQKKLAAPESGMERLKAYTRAQWETTQFLMDKAGQSHAELYRGIILPKEDLDATTNIDVKVNTREPVAGMSEADFTKTYVQLPDVDIKRNGASSTSSSESVSNNWGGAGGWNQQPKNSARVVLRFKAPASSLISLPVFGANLHNESEYVLIGTKDKWQWDAWRHKAPTFKDHPIGGKTVSDVKAAAKKLVIDMAEHDQGPHWLTGYVPPFTPPHAKPRMAARRRRGETSLHAAADAHMPVIAKAMAAAFKAGREAINVPLLRAALAAGNQKRAQSAVAAVPGAIRAKLMKVLPPITMAVLTAGGEAGMALLKKKMRYASSARLRTAIKLDWSFDDKNERAQTWAREHAAELAKGLSDTTRDEIGDALIDAFDEGGDTDTLIDAVSDAVGDDVRGELIARTESMIMTHEGQRESWRQAIEEGGLPEDAQREWIVVGDMKVCDECGGLDGAVADVDGMYPDPGGSGPPQHPRCRCTEGITASRAAR